MSVKKQRVDYVVSFLRGVAAGTPIVGGVLSEAINMAIPGQQQDRIADYIEKLSNKVDEISQISSLPQNSSKLKFVNESLAAVVYAETDYKAEVINKIVENSFVGDESVYDFDRMILRVVNSLTSMELEYLLNFEDISFKHSINHNEKWIKYLYNYTGEFGVSKFIESSLFNVGIIKKSYQTTFLELNYGHVKLDVNDAMENFRYEPSLLGRTILKKISCTIDG